MGTTASRIAIIAAHGTLDAAYPPPALPAGVSGIIRRTGNMAKEAAKSIEDIYGEISAQVAEFDAGHTAFFANGNKSAAARARKAIGEVKRRATEYRRLSVEACKKK